MRPEIPPNAGRSWWLREALALPEFIGEPSPPLAREITADVVILGGGYTGMWTAYHLKEHRPLLDVALLEQDICGGGASGRNGGFVNSWWSDLGELCERFGDDAALALCRAGEESVREIGSFCERHGIDAWLTRGGDVGAATSAAQLGAWQSNVEAAERLGVPRTFTVLSADRLRERCDSPTFLGGVLEAGGATVQPARLARGLRRVLLERGVRIFEETPVTRFRAAPNVRVETPGGAVRAERAVIALNAWGAAWRRFRRLITIRGSYIVLTAPVPDELERINWTGGESIWDFRAAIHYLRTTPDGRIAFGVGGLQPGLARRVGPRFAYDPSSLAVAVDDLHRMFPSFRGVPIEAGWGGPIDVAGHHVPVFGSAEGAFVHYGLGFTGNGVGPSHLGGRILAALTLGEISPELLALPVVNARPIRFPPEPLRSWGAWVVNRAIHRKDRAEDRGDRPTRVTSFLAHLPRRLGYNLGP